MACMSYRGWPANARSTFGNMPLKQAVLVLTTYDRMSMTNSKQKSMRLFLGNFGFQATGRVSNISITIMCTIHDPSHAFCFLTLISHRATKINPEIRLQKLQGFIQPVQQLWQNPEMAEAISSFSGFCDSWG